MEDKSVKNFESLISEIEEKQNEQLRVIEEKNEEIIDLYKKNEELQRIIEKLKNEILSLKDYIKNIETQKNKKIEETLSEVYAIAEITNKIKEQNEEIQKLEKLTNEQKNQIRKKGKEII